MKMEVLRGETRTGGEAQGWFTRWTQQTWGGGETGLGVGNGMKVTCGRPLSQLFVTGLRANLLTGAWALPLVGAKTVKGSARGKNLLRGRR